MDGVPFRAMPPPVTEPGSTFRCWSRPWRKGTYSVEYIRNLRTTIEHNILLGNVPEIMDKIKEYGIIINVNHGDAPGCAREHKGLW